MDKVLNRRLLLGVTGGIAAYKVAELSRLLMRNNVDVQVAMTDAATRFVTAATFQALTGKPVITDLWDARFENNMAHIELSRGVDAIVVAPASAELHRETRARDRRRSAVHRVPRAQLPAARGTRR